MATTSPSTDSFRRRRLPTRWTVGIVVAAVAVLGTGVVSLTTGPGSAAEPWRFWKLVGGVYLEVDTPQDVDEISRRADAVVVAHVTGVVDGRQDPGFEGPAPAASAPIPRTCFVQLTVDKVVKGAVTEKQVLTLEMYTPPRPLGLEAARDVMPSDPLLFFLYSGEAVAKRGGSGVAAQLQEKGIWGPLGSHGIVGAGQDGLVLPLDPGEPDLTFLRSFGATTLDGAADRAAQSVR